MKTLKQIAGLFLFLAALSFNTFAETKPAPQLTPEQKATLLSKYKSVLLEQTKVQAKVDAFNAEYQKVLAGLPKGFSISVNPDADTVDVVPPKEEPATAASADKDKK